MDTDRAGAPEGKDAERTLQELVDELNELAMFYETAVFELPAEHYAEEFYEFYELSNRPELIPAPNGFAEALVDVSGGGRGEPIVEKTLSLFGPPRRAMIYEDSRPVVDELEADGQGPWPFFFIFDVMFAEYDDFTLCFISGTNN